MSGLKSGRRLLWLVVVVVVMSGGCGGDGRRESVPWTRMPNPPGATSTELEWRFEAVYGGSSCSDFDGWTVDETATEVVVTARATFQDGDCTGDQVREPHVVVLEEPLGTRRLVGCEPDQDSADCMLFDRFP